MATEDTLLQPIVHPRHKRYTVGTGTLKRMMKKVGRDHEDPSLDVSMQYSRGLNNPTGENNCFLNSAVQVLWHLEVFRRNFKLVDGHACMGDACIFCALKVLFTQFQYSDKESLPPDSLRRALAISFTKEKRFQLRSMDDAAECVENILLQIHFCLTNNVEDSECTAKHCIPHTKFAMTILAQSQCECGATSEPFLYKEIVRYISSVSLCSGVKNLENWRHSASFGEVLQNAALEKKECPSKCGKTAEVRCDLMNAPDVVTIGIIWDCDPSVEHITEVIKVIKGSVKIKDMYSNVLEVDSDGGVYELVGLIAYYGKHYCTFFHHSHMKQWLYLEDSKVKPLGSSWHRVTDICIKSRYQPCLLFYSNPKWTKIDPSDAPRETNLLPGYTRTCKSPDVDNKTAAAADYWPRKKIAEYDRDLGASNKIGTTESDGGVIEIGQAAMGLVRTPEGILSATREDNQNNNLQCPPHLSGDQSQSGSTQGTSVSNGGGRFQEASSGSGRVSHSGQPLRKKDSKKAGSSASQTSQNGPTSGDIRGGLDPDAWELLFDQHKQEESEKRKRVKSTPTLEVKPLDPFDISLLGSKPVEPPGAKSLCSLLTGDRGDDGFEVYLNDAFIDSTNDSGALSGGKPTRNQGRSQGTDRGRTARDGSRQGNLSIPLGRTRRENAVGQSDPSEMIILSPDNSWEDLSPVMCAAGEPGILSQELSSVGLARRTESDGALKPKSDGKLSPVELSSSNDKGYHSGHMRSPHGAAEEQNLLSDELGSVGPPGRTRSDRAHRPQSGGNPSPANIDQGYQGYHPGHRGVSSCAEKKEGSFSDQLGSVRLAGRTQSNRPPKPQCDGNPIPANSDQGYQGYHPGHEGAPFWFAPKDPRTQQREEELPGHRSSRDRHVAASSSEYNLVNGADRTQQGEAAGQREHGHSERVTSTPPTRSKDELDGTEGRLTRNERSWAGLDDEQRVLWEEIKRCMMESSEAEDSGDSAAGLGEITQAAAKLKALLSKLPRDGEQRERIERLYRKANEKRRQLMRQLVAEDESSARTYNSSLSNGEDVPQPNRFLQDAVDNTRAGLFHHECSRNYIPVTHWKDMSHKVRQVPIVVEGHHGSTLSHHGGCISPTREIPVKVYSTLPRQDKSRPFFVTSSNMRR